LVINILSNYKILIYHTMKLISFLLILSLTACNEHVESSKMPIVISKEDSIKNTLIGRWGGLGESNPVWEIRKDSIYYFQHSRAYFYKILNHDLIIDFRETQAKFLNINVIKDTLFFSDEQGYLTKAYRFK